jgi:hypothetical protein
MPRLSDALRRIVRVFVTEQKISFASIVDLKGGKPMHLFRKNKRVLIQAQP